MTTAELTTPLVLHDRWEGLPGLERAAFLAQRAATGRWQHGAAEGWLRRQTWQPMRPLILDGDGYRELGRIAGRVLRLAVDACLRRAATAAELGEALHDHRPHRLLDTARPLSDMPLLRMARPDVLLCGGVPQFVELNIAIALYGIPALDRMAEAYARLRPDGALSVPPSTHRARTELLARSVPRQPGTRPRVLVPTWSSRSGPAGRLGNRRALRAYLQPTVDAARAAGVDAVVEDLSRLRTDSLGRLLAGGSPVDAVLNWFVSARVTRDGGGLEAIATALAAGTVQLFFPEAMRLLNSKQALAWLHEDLDLLPPEDRATVRAYVPWTGWTGPQQPADERERFLGRALRDRQALVLKPAIGANGRGVVFGADLPDAAWRDLITERAAKGPLVAQRRVAADTVPMPFLAPESGGRRDLRIPCVLAPFMVDGRICGALVRHFGPDRSRDSRVINTRTGAIPNTVLLS